MQDTYDVIVVGGGHAGCEAALASARMGCATLLVTMRIDKIGFMSCNPAIGGIGKGQLVKEVDALGGEMARATDACGIQFRILNASKGPAVWSSRAQVDRKEYSLYMQKITHSQDNLDVLEAEVTELLVRDNTATGIITKSKDKIRAKTVIITPGTFLNGVIHIGMKTFEAGRIEEKKTSKSLSIFLGNLNLHTLRFNTCTSARLDGKTIDFSRMKVQNGDNPPKPFSFSTKNLNIKQVPCHLTYSNEKTHKVIRRNVNRCPSFSGKINGPSVRYCPSFEDKVIKFPHHARHQVFLEPEGMKTDEYYPNGLFTIMPENVQEEYIHTIPGLENVKINRFGYGIEYDVVNPSQLYPTLETKRIKNLYLAGQINGTTGYEEAAAQGLIAGINASLEVKKKHPLILDRSTSYIGVLIDDLVTKGTNEPYRMFTSRVEYRLILREDNADIRLRKIGYNVSLVKEKDYKATLDKQKQIENALKYLREAKAKAFGKTLYELLKRPEFNFDKLKMLNLVDKKMSSNLEKRVEIQIKYSGYIKKQLLEVKRFKHLEKIKIPPYLDFSKIPGLSNEIREKLSKFKPLSLGQASRISGITPVSVSILMVYLKK